MRVDEPNVLVSLMGFHRQYHHYSCIGLVCAFSTFHMCPSVLHFSARTQPYCTQHIREAALIEEYSEAAFIRDLRRRAYILRVRIKDSGTYVALKGI